MSEEIQSKNNQFISPSQQFQQIPQNPPSNSLPGNQSPTPAPTHFPTMVYGIGQMLGGGVQQQANPHVSVIASVEGSPTNQQFPALQPKSNSEVSEHLSSILQLTNQLNSMTTAPTNPYQRNTSGGTDKHTITSSSLPLNEKTIKNMGKRKMIQPVANNTNSQAFTVQVIPPPSQIAAKNNNMNVIQTQPIQNFQQLPNPQLSNQPNLQPQTNILPNPQYQQNKVGAQQPVQANNTLPNPTVNQKLRESNFSNDNQTAPQYLPEDFSQLPSLNVVPTQNIQPVVSVTPPVPVNAPIADAMVQQLGRASNVSTAKTGQAWAYTPHNANYQFNKQLKVSNVSALSEFNSLQTAPNVPNIPNIPNIPNVPLPNNTFNSTATTANYPQLATTIPSNIQSNMTPNSFQNTQSYYVPQNQQKPPQQSQLNIQQRSNVPQSQLSQQNYINNSFAGFAPIGSGIPSFLGDGSGIDKSKFTMPSINPTPPSYLNNKNPF